MRKIRFVFFGTPQLSVIVLEQLKNKGMLPTLVVTAPDKPVGRGMKTTASPVKKWSFANNIPTLEPEVFDDEVIEKLTQEKADVFVLVAYGKILSKEVLNISPRGILNVHPSLLPELRGPSPVRTAILNDAKVTGVSVMLIDEKMDHGPILVQEAYEPGEWPPQAQELDEYLFTRGGALLAEIMPQYVQNEVTLQEQEHEAATYSKLFRKEDGLLDLDDDAYQNLLKIHAFQGWPGTYFFAEKNGKRVRINVLSAHIENGTLIIDEIVPEGKGKMQYSDFLS